MWRLNCILFVFILGCFISTIFLVIQSNKNNNKLGTIIGYIFMFFLLFFPIQLYLVGKYFSEYYNIVSIFVFGILILYIMAILLVGLSTNTTEHLTPAQGICYKNGKMGYVIDGDCDISNTKNCDIAVANSISKNCPSSASSSSSKSSPSNPSGSSSRSATRSSTSDTNEVISIVKEENGETQNDQDEQEEPFEKIDDSPPPIGICGYTDNGKKKFGFRHPDYGKSCLSKDQMLLAIKSNPKFQVKGISYSVPPFQSTECQNFPKTDYINYDIQCKKKFGVNYGLKLIENQGCEKNDYRAKCEIGWQAGVKLEDNSTKCVPIGKDMNVQCQIKHVDNPGKFGKYLRIGYKTIDFSGCPKGSQRAICDGNYYDGKELFEKTTAPFPQTENPNRKCQQQFGLLSFAKKINSENCAVGYIRAECN